MIVIFISLGRGEKFIFWHIDPLLSGDSVNNSRCNTIGEKVNTRFYAMVEVLLDYNNGSGVFDVVRAEML
jgi:hypothetical protein